jgi:hypothetical protein
VTSRATAIVLPACGESAAVGSSQILIAAAVVVASSGSYGPASPAGEPAGLMDEATRIGL